MCLFFPKSEWSFHPFFPLPFPPWYAEPPSPDQVPEGVRFLPLYRLQRPQRHLRPAARPPGAQGEHGKEAGDLPDGAGEEGGNKKTTFY